ncbi:MAG: peroxiredoxin [Saprospiraceae bacterium]
MQCKVKVGEAIPNFQAFTDDGIVIDRSYFLGSKFVMFFYGTDGSPTCTNEAKSVAAVYDKLMKKGYKVVGISRDTVKAHKKFRLKENFPFTLISDPELDMHNVFGVYGPKIFMGKEVNGIYRTTFLTSENGIITSIIDNVVSKSHGDQILNTIQSLQ